MYRQSHHLLISNLCPWAVVIRFFLFSDQYHLWCGCWKVHLKCFRPLILCDFMAVLSIVDQFLLKIAHHIFFCDVDCPGSCPGILSRLPIGLYSPALIFIYFTHISMEIIVKFQFQPSWALLWVGPKCTSTSSPGRGGCQVHYNIVPDFSTTYYKVHQRTQVQDQSLKQCWYIGILSIRLSNNMQIK